MLKKTNIIKIIPIIVIEITNNYDNNIFIIIIKYFFFSKYYEVADLKMK